MCIYVYICTFFLIVGLTLDKSKYKEVWDPDMKASDKFESPGLRGEHTLLVKQVRRKLYFCHI